MALASLVAMATVPGCHSKSITCEPLDMTPYLGTWRCIGIDEDGAVRDLKNYEVATGRSHGARIVVRDNGFTYIHEEEDGAVSSVVERWLTQDFRASGNIDDEDSYRRVPEGPPYLDGYFELSDGRLLKSESDGTTLIFGKESDSPEPLLRRVQLPGCPVDVPIELLEDYDTTVSCAAGAESMFNGSVVVLSGRR